MTSFAGEDYIFTAITWAPLKREKNFGSQDRNVLFAMRKILPVAATK